jgi:hypothetical protein
MTLCPDKCEVLNFYGVEGQNHHYICIKCKSIYSISFTVPETADKLKEKYKEEEE